MSEPRWLTPREAAAWRAYLRLRTRLDLQIGRDLARDSELSDADYHVLATLSVATDGRERLLDLANGMSWSPSRLAHHVDRMRGRGLVEKGPHPAGSRAVVVALTEHGRAVLEAAAPLHVASVHEHFTGLLTDEQLDAFAAAADTVAAHLRTVQTPTPG